MWDRWKWIANYCLDSQPFVKIPHFDDLPMDICQCKQVGANSICTKLLKQANNTLSHRLCKAILLVYWFTPFEQNGRWLSAQLWKQKAKLYTKSKRVFSSWFWTRFIFDILYRFGREARAIFSENAFSGQIIFNNSQIMGTQLEYVQIL